MSKVSQRASKISTLQVAFVDLSAVLFAIGGVGSLVMSLLTVTLISAGIPVTFITVFLVVLAISLICSLGSIHCYTLATKGLLSEAGMRGMIFGALLLIFSLGFVVNFRAVTSTTMLAQASALLVLIGGVTCFILRHLVPSSSALMHQESIAHPA